MTDAPIPQYSSESGDAQIRRAAKEAAPSAQVVRSEGDLLVYYAGFNLSKFVRFLALQPYVAGTGGAAQAEPDRGALTKLAAECHRAKWEFDLSEDYRPSKPAARAMILKAFAELHRIGDLALKLRDASTVPSTDRCAECGHPRAEHSYNGACYGLCGKFVPSMTSPETK